MARQSGQWLLHYRLVEKIGEGAMGSVWRAEDTTLDRDAAVKILPDALAKDSQFLARFKREAKLLAAFSHPNLAAVYGVHQADSTRFLAMELVPGEDLSQRLGRGPLPIDEAVRVMGQIASALEAAHGRGVVHRDLKPANVRLMPNGQIKVLDFGLAKTIESDASAEGDTGGGGELPLTMAGVVLGTAPYMSPEQARGQPVDARTDIWSFGCVLWECLTGRRPFPAETFSDQIAAILHEEPDWTRLPANTPSRVVRVLRRCLAKDPCLRFHHIADARIELEDVAQVAELDASPAPDADAAPRSPRVVAALGVLLAAAIGLLLLNLRHEDREEPPPAPANPLATATPNKLTNWPGAEFDAAISPNGRWVVFVSDRKGPFEVFVGQIDTRNFEPVLQAGKMANVRVPVRNVGFVGDGSQIWIGGGLADGRTQAGRRGGSSMQAIDLLGGQPKDILPPEAVNAAWTRDAQRVVYHHGKGGDRIFVADADGANETEVPVPTEDGYHQHYPMWSFDSQWIFISRGWVTTGAVDLWRVRPSGKDLEQLTWEKRLVGYPTPLDEKTVLYVAQEANGAGPWLWALDLETKTSRRAGIGMEHYSSVSASADGKRVVATIENSQASLWTVPILEEREGTERDVKPYPLSAPRALLPRVRGDDLYYLSSPGSADGLWRKRDGETIEILKGAEAPLLEPPAISPDGQFAAVSIREGARVALWLISTTGRGRKRLGGPLVPRGAADWSPDGKWVVVGGSVSGQKGLYKVDVETDRPTLLLKGEAINPVWSPDDSMIVYTGPQLNTWTPLIAVRPESGDPVEGFPEINVIANGERARFLPDASGLVYMEGLNPGQDFYLLKLETMKPRRLTRIDTATRMRTFDITKDGKSIIFDRVRQDSDIVMFKWTTR